MSEQSRARRGSGRVGLARLVTVLVLVGATLSPALSCAAAARLAHSCSRLDRTPLQSAIDEDIAAGARVVSYIAAGAAELEKGTVSKNWAAAHSEEVRDAHAPAPSPAQDWAATVEDGQLLRPKSGFAPIRLRFDVTHLFTAGSFCTAPGQLRSDMLQTSNITCTALDVLTEEKRAYLLERVLPVVYQRITRVFSVPGRPSARGRGERMRVPQGMCGELLWIPPSHTRDGLADVDLVVYVLAAPSPPDTSTSTIAWSGYCGVDREGRPAVARVNFSPRFISPYGARAEVGPGTVAAGSAEARPAPALEGDPVAWATEAYTRAVMHELLHALGFAPPLLRSLGVRRLSTAGDLMKGGGGAPLDERYGNISGCTAPLVVAAARRYFQCDHLRAVPLEEEGGRGSAGAHWCRRLLREEVMAPAPSPVAALSLVTLAVFHSLPFYSVDARYAEVGMVWGRGAGCDFLQPTTAAAPTCKPVTVRRAWGLEPRLLSSGQGSSRTAEEALAYRLTPDEVTRARHWCLDGRGLVGSRATPWPRTEEAGAGGARYGARSLARALPLCTSDRRRIGRCGLAPAGTGGANIPLSGSSPFMDGCPVVESIASPFRRAAAAVATATVTSPVIAANAAEVEVACTAVPILSGGRAGGYVDSPAGDATTGSTVPSTVPDFLGPQSRCVHVVQVEGGAVASAHPHCLRTRCVDGERVEVQVGLVWVACPSGGQPGLVPIPGEKSGVLLACEDAAVLCDPALWFPSANASLAVRASSRRRRRPSPAAPVPLHEVVVDLAVSVRGGALASAAEACGLPPHEWAAALFRRLTDALVALQADLDELLGSGAELDVQLPLRPGRLRVLPGTLALVAFVNDSATTRASRPRESALPSHGTRRRRDVERRALLAAESAVEPWLVVTFTLAVSVDSPASEVAVVARLRDRLTAATRVRRRRSGRGDGGGSVGSGGPSALSEVARRGLCCRVPKPSGAPREDVSPACWPLYLQSSTTVPGATTHATQETTPSDDWRWPGLFVLPGGGESWGQRGACALCDGTRPPLLLAWEEVWLADGREPPPVLDGPPALDVAAAADVVLLLRLDGQGGSVAPAGEKAASDPRPAVAAWRLTPDTVVSIGNGLRADLAAALLLTPNLVAVNAVWDVESERADGAVGGGAGSCGGSGGGCLLAAHLTLHTPPLLHADTRRSTRAAWRARLTHARDAAEDSGGPLLPRLEAAVDRVVQGSPPGALACARAAGERLACEEVAAGWRARLAGFVVHRPEPAGSDSTAAWASRSARRVLATLGATDEANRGRLWDEPDGGADPAVSSRTYCVPVPQRLRRSGRICGELSLVMLSLGLATVVLVVAMSTIAYATSDGGAESGGDDDDAVEEVAFGDWEWESSKRRML